MSGVSDDEAFAEAYRTHYRSISRYVARRLSGEAHELDELVAEVFSVAWRRRKTCRTPRRPGSTGWRGSAWPTRSAVVAGAADCSAS